MEKALKDAKILDVVKNRHDGGSRGLVVKVCSEGLCVAWNCCVETPLHYSILNQDICIDSSVTLFDPKPTESKRKPFLTIKAERVIDGNLKPAYKLLEFAMTPREEEWIVGGEHVKISKGGDYLLAYKSPGELAFSMNIGDVIPLDEFDWKGEFLDECAKRVTQFDQLKAKEELDWSGEQLIEF